MDNWDEMRTAWQVARLGTISAAAEALGVHHATVIRHIDALERHLGTKLFQRHARGYAPTDAGRDLLAVASSAADQFAQLEGRLRGQGTALSGELTLTSIPEVASVITTDLVAFQIINPGVRLRLLTESRLYRLEYGEAHIAIRAGARPQEPDNVVQSFGVLRSALYAARSYAVRHPLGDGMNGLRGHCFVGAGGESRAPHHIWLEANVPASDIQYRANDPAARIEAICAGAGIGFVPVDIAARHPDLIEVLPSRPEWDATFWLVSHVDLHRSPNVQALLAHLKDAASLRASA